MIKLSVDVCKKIGEAGSFGSRGAGCGFSEIEIDHGMLSDPAALAARIRSWYALAETAMDEELVRLNGRAAARPAQIAASVIASPPTATNGSSRHLEQPPPAQVNGHVVAEDYDDTPQNGSQLLGWARKQLPDCKNWIIGYGRKMNFEGKVLEWSQAQVNQAYLACKKAQRTV